MDRAVDSIKICVYIYIFVTKYVLKPLTNKRYLSIQAKISNGGIGYHIIYQQSLFFPQMSE